MTERLNNSADSKLTADINNSVTSLTVISAAGFPTSGNFRIVIDSEIMLVTGVSTNTFTVTRGQEGTTAASHTSGTTVKHTITSGGLTQYLYEATYAGTTGTVAGRPAATKSGRNYFTTNGPYNYRDNGSGYDTFFPSIKIKEPQLANFTSINPVNAVYSEVNGGILMVNNTSNGSAFSMNMLQQTAALPTAPWKLTAAFYPCLHPLNFSLYGIAVRNNTSGLMVTIRMSNDSSNTSFYVERMTNATTISATLYNSTHNSYRGVGDLIWMEIEDNATNRIYKMGTAPWSMINIYSETNTTFVTANRAVAYINPYNRPTATQLVHWDLR